MKIKAVIRRTFAGVVNNNAMYTQHFFTPRHLVNGQRAHVALIRAIADLFSLRFVNKMVDDESNNLSAYYQLLSSLRGVRNTKIDAKASAKMEFLSRLEVNVTYRDSSRVKV